MGHSWHLFNGKFLLYTLFYTHTKTHLPSPSSDHVLFIWVNLAFLPLFLNAHCFFSCVPYLYLLTSFSSPSLLQGLRKSSDCGRTKRTIMPHSVPHMVRLRKFIVSEDTVFLLLQYAEGKTHSSHAHLFRFPSFVFFTSNCLFHSFT